jgi:hypothetical protein
VHRREEAGKAALEDAERLRADRLVAVQQVVNRRVPPLEVLVQAVGAGRQVRLVSCSLWYELMVTRIICFCRYVSLREILLFYTGFEAVRAINGDILSYAISESLNMDHHYRDAESLKGSQLFENGSICV